MSLLVTKSIILNLPTVNTAVRESRGENLFITQKRLSSKTFCVNEIYFLINLYLFLRITANKDYELSLDSVSGKGYELN